MLNLENKILIIIMILFVSCENNTNNLKPIDNIYFEKSLSAINKIDSNNYFKIYNTAKDSINNWLTELTSYNFLKSGTWELDSLLCFDEGGQSCVMCIKSKCELDPKCVMDDLHYFLGKVINGKWYFFQTGDVV